MATPSPLLSELQLVLPESWHAPVQTLADATLQTDTPLRLILVGAFSVGKSSLLNMLIEEPLLQTALEETTALPTFIEYAEERSMQLLGCDGSVLALDEAGFARATTQAPDGAACAVLNLPHAWLKGLSIIDLPGLGSVSASHREYTLTQIRQADAVIYLIDPRGPAQSDVETLKLIQETGKRVKVLVTRWDTVATVVARGEKTPSLEQWSAQIEAGAGLRVRLAPCSRDGLGREDVLDFLQRAQADLGDIRQRRFRAELKPILDNALGQNAQSQRSCEAGTEEAAQALHQDLMQRKQALSELKSGLYAQQQQDRERIAQQCGAILDKGRQKLVRQLDDQAAQLASEAEWGAFGEQGRSLQQSGISGIARAFSALSSQYGALDLPEAQVADFNLRLPSPESVDANDFLDVGKLSQLQHELALRQDELAATEQKLSSMQPADMSEQERTLHELLQQRQTLAAEPLPRIVQRVSDGNGAAMGRMLGGMADIALMFVSPVTAGAKIASLIGQGAKMANVAVNTAKVAGHVQKGLKVAQGVQIGKRVAGVPPQVMEKLGALEVLSLGYWGERLGSMLGGGPRDEEVIDPQAIAEQQAAFAAIDAQSQNLRRALARNEDIANERQLTGWALEQSQKEQARLQGELARLKTQAEQKHREAERDLAAERQTLLKRHAERAVSQWLRSFDQQTAAMLDLIHARVKSYWEDRVDVLVGERLQELDALSEQAKASAEEKQAALLRLRDEAKGIDRAIAALA